MKVKIENNINKWGNRTIDTLDSALSRMAKDIKQIASITVPFKSGELQKSIEDQKIGLLRHRVLVDKPYASYQERGMRADGSRVVKKYTTAGTGKGYLKKAGDKVCKQGINYLKQANRLLK